MKFKPVFLAFLATSLILTLLIAPMIDATSPSVVVTTDNLVLLNPDGSINFTTIYCTSIDEANLGEGVKLLKLVVENGSSFPVSPVDKQVFFRSDTGILYIYNTAAWTSIGVPPATYPYANLTDVPDLSVVLTQNASRTLLSNWNAGNSGAYGIYGLSYVDTAVIHVAEVINSTVNGYVKVMRLVIENSSTAPSTPVLGYIYFDTTDNTPYAYNGTHWLPMYNSTLSGGSSPDLTVYLFVNGTRPLTADWDVGGYGVIGASWLNTTSLSLTSELWWNGYNRTDILAHPQDSFNFLIFKEGGVVYAKNGITWQCAVSTVQGCIDALTSTGGSVIVRNASYAENVTLKNNTRLVLDKGVTGINVTIDAGATAVLQDFNDLQEEFYYNGFLVFSVNTITGAVTGDYGAFKQYFYGDWVSGWNNRTDAIANPFAWYSYLIDNNAGSYRMKNGTTAQIDFESSNLTLVEQFAEANLTSGLILLKDVEWNSSLGMPSDDIMVVQSYLGELEYISAQAKFIIPQLAADPNTTGWTTTERGRMWYNTGEDTLKYWNGTAIVEVPGIGGGGATYTLPFSYMVYKSGSNTVAEKYDGTLTSGADAATIINGAISALPGSYHSGTIFVKTGAYTITSTITVYKHTQIIGESGTTNFTASGAVNVFTVDSSECDTYNWKISNLRIACNSQNSIGIYSLNAADHSGWGVSEISDVIINGVKAGYAGINLTNHFNLNLQNNHITTSGSGIVLLRNASDMIQYGNSYFANNRVISDGDNAVLMNVTSTLASYPLMLTTMANLQLLGPNDGVIGLFMRGVKKFTFIGGTIETCNDTLVYLDDVENCAFYGLHIGAGSSAGYGVRLVNDCIGNSFEGCYIWVHSTGTSYSDESPDATHNVIGSGTRMGAGTEDYGANTVAVSYDPDDTGAGSSGNATRGIERFVILTDGSYTWAVDEDGVILENQTYANTNVVITSAFGNLTSGRTWKETVTIKGNYTGLDQITPPSYTIFQIAGTLKAKNSLNTDFIYATGKTHIDIIGGFIDGNKAGQSDDMSVIRFVSSTYCTVQYCEVTGGFRTDPVVSNARGEGIEFGGCTYCKALFNYVHETDYDNIKLRDTSVSCEVSYNTCIDSENSSNIQLAGDGTERNIISNNILMRTEGGTLPVLANIKIHYADRNLITGNVMYGTNPISIIDTADDNAIKNNYIYQATDAQSSAIVQLTNIGTGESYDTVISDNYVYNCRKRFVQIDDGNRVQILNNHVYSEAAATSHEAVYIASGVDDTRVAHNYFYNMEDGFNNAGTGTVYNDNYPSPYLSENSVSSANTTATTFVFNHGLISTADFVWVSFNFTGWTSWTWTSTTTQITVTVTGTLPASMTCYCKCEYDP